MKPAPWPSRKMRCSRTLIKYRARNPIWKNKQTERTATDMNRIVKEAIEKQLFPETSKREAGFILTHLCRRL